MDTLFFRKLRGIQFFMKKKKKPIFSIKSTCYPEHDHIVNPLNIIRIELKISRLSPFFSNPLSLLPRLLITFQLFPFCNIIFQLKIQRHNHWQLNDPAKLDSDLLDFRIFSFDFFGSLAATFFYFFYI